MAAGAPHTRFLLFFYIPTYLTPVSVGQCVSSYRGAMAKTRFSLFAVAFHRRHGLARAPLRRASVDHEHWSSTGTRFTATSACARSLCSWTCTSPVFAEHVRAHSPAALCVSGSICDMPVLRPGILAQSCDELAEACVDKARYRILMDMPRRTRRANWQKLSLAAITSSDDACFCTGAQEVSYLAICNGRPTPVLRERTMNSV